MSARPVYIPPGKRKSSNNPQRFHGAFTGGFSAGYFNTVDTKEGWKPSTDQRKDQRLEDFMDDQDHVEWGGPTKVRQDYNNNTKNDDVATNHAAQKEPLDSLFTISHQSIGPQLLRRLGWREGGGAAFVPLSQDEQHHQSKKEDDEETIIVLSKKRLKKIELQTKRIQIPPPKLDACGLGFAPHKDAPEFRQYQERRKQLARERGMGGGSNHNVYRTSTIMTETNKGELAQTDKKSSDNTQNTDDYLSHETAEDFVGKLSVGGFALRDDEDDAYDNRHASHARKPTQMNLGEEYNMEIYEHHESDEEDTGQGIVSLDPSKTIGNNGGLRQTKTDLGGILSSWANTSSTSNQKSVALTSDGRPPLEGFVLGGSMESHKKRYPGPDMPREYMVKRHVFGENEHPLIFQTIARAVQLQEREQQRQKFHKHQQQPLVAGGTFSNLGNAMKIRFTSSKKEESEGPERAGLYKPDPVVLAKQPEEETPSNEPLVTKKPIVLQRTVQSFLPHPLLCKRFGVPIPKNSMGSSFASSAMISHVPGRVTEANYFETEILAARNTDKQAKNESKQKGSDARGDDAKPDDNDKVEKEDPTVIQRPSMVKLKSIYEPESDSESSTDLDASSDDEGKESEKEPTQKDTDLDASNDGEVKESEKEPAQKDEENQDANDSSASSLASDSRQRERHRRKKSHRRHSKKRRKRSRSPGDSEDDRRRRKERRRKHDRKQRKQSSRRKKDKDP